MNLCVKMAAVLLVLANALSIQAMEQAQTQSAVATKIEFGVYAHNTTSRTINIMWIDKRGNQKTKLIEAGKTQFISKYADLQMNYAIKFAAYGDWMGYSAIAVEAPFVNLSEKWFETKKSTEDNLLLTVTTSRILYLDLLYSALEEKKAVARTDIPAEKALELFPRLSKYPAVLACLTNDKVLAFEKWDQEVLPASSFLYRATTAEDVYRYILGLPTIYTEAMVKDSYRKLATELHPDKLPQNAALAHVAFTLITKAYEGLLEALKAKRGSGEWVFVNSGN